MNRHPSSLVVRALLVVGLASSAACEGPPATRPSGPGTFTPAPRAPSSSTSVPPAMAVGLALASSAGRPFAVSLDDRVLVRVMNEPRLGRVLAVDDLSSARAPTRLVPVGAQADIVGFVAPNLVLTFDEKAHEARVVPVDGTAASTPLHCDVAPVVDPAGRRIVSLDASRHIFVADAKTLAVEWRDDKTTIPEGASELERVWASDAIASFSWGGGIVAVDANAHRELFASVNADATHTRPVFSSSGRMLAYCSAVDAASGWSIFLLDPTSGWHVVLRRNAMSAPVVAFRRDEKQAAVVTDPSTVTLVSLPRGTEKTVRTGQSAATEGYSFLVDRLAFTDDGRFVCGHTATDIGKYTDCSSQVLVDVKREAAKPRGTPACVIDGDVAGILSLGAVAELDGRRALSTSSATYTHTCNDTASTDHSLQAVVTSKTDPKTGDYVDTEVVIVDIAAAKVLHRFPLGAGPRGMGENVFVSFSPRAKVATVVFDGTESTFDLVRGVRLEGIASDATFSPSEALALSHRDGSLVITTVRDGAQRTFPDGVSGCERNGLVVPCGDP